MLTRYDSLRPRPRARSGFILALACCAALAGCKSPWLKEEPPATAALQAQADAAYENGEWQQAAASLQTLANAAPADARLQFRLGNALVRTGRLEEAIAAYSTSLMLDPAQPKALHNQSVAYLRLARDGLAQAARTSADAELAERAAGLTRQIDTLLEPASR